jgi:hypothetical protein
MSSLDVNKTAAGVQFFPGIAGNAAEGANAVDVYKVYRESLKEDPDVGLSLPALFAAVGLINAKANEVGPALDEAYTGDIPSDWGPFAPAQPGGAPAALPSWVQTVRERGRLICRISWQSPNPDEGGHAMWLGVTQDANGGFVFTVYNLGLGMAQPLTDGTHTACAISRHVKNVEDASKIFGSFRLLGASKVGKLPANTFLESFGNPTGIIDLTSCNEDGLKESIPPAANRIGGIISIPTGNAITSRPQVIGNCTAASLQAMVQHLIVGGNNNFENPDMLDLQNKLITFYSMIRVMQQSVKDIESADANDRNYRKSIKIATLELNTVVQTFEQLRHRIQSADLLHTYDRIFTDMRLALVEALQNAPVPVREIHLAGESGVNLRQLLPPIADRADPVEVPVFASSPLGDSCKKIDAAVRVMREGVASDRRWAAFFSGIEVFHGGKGALTFGGVEQDRLVADALKSLISRDLPLADLPHFLTTKAFDEEKLLLLLNAILDASMFAGKHLPSQDVAKYSVSTQNLFLTLQGIYLSCMRQIVQLRQNGIKSEVEYYKPFDPKTFYLKIPPIDESRDLCVDVREIARRKTLARLFGTPVEQPGIPVNAKIGGDPLKKGFASITRSFYSLLDGLHGSPFTNLIDELDACAGANGGAHKAQEAILDELRNAAAELQRMKEKPIKLEEARKLKKGAEDELRRLETEINTRTTKLTNLRMELSMRETEYTTAKNAHDTHKRDIYDPLFARWNELCLEKEEYRKNLTALEEVISRLAELRDENKGLSPEETRLQKEIKDAESEHTTYARKVTTLEDALRKREDAAKRDPAKARSNSSDVDAARKALASTRAEEARTKTALLALQNELARVTERKRTIADELAAAEKQVIDLKGKLGMTSISTDDAVAKGQVELEKKTAEYNDFYTKNVQPAQKKLEKLQLAMDAALKAYDDAKKAAADMELFVNALAMRRGHVADYVRQIDIIITKISSWAGPDGPEAKELQVRVDLLWQDLGRLARRGYICGGIMRELWPEGAGKLEPNIAKNFGGVCYGGLQKRLLDKSSPHVGKLQHVLSRWDADFDEKVVKQKKKIPEYDALGETISVTVSVDGSTLSFTSTICPEIYPATAEFGHFDPVTLAKKGLGRDDCDALDKQFADYLKYRAADTPLIGVPLLQAPFAAGMTPHAQENTRVHDMLPEIMHHADGAIRNYVHMAGGTRGADSGSIAGKYFQDPTHWTRNIPPDSARPMAAVGLADWGMYANAFTLMNASAMGNTKDPIHISSPQSKNPRQRGAGLPDVHWTGDPEAIAKAMSELVPCPAFSESRQKDSHLQTGTIQGRTSANAKLLEIQQSGLLSSIPVQLRKAFVNDTQDSATVLLNLITVLSNEAETMRDLPDILTIIEQVMAYIAVPARTGTIIQEMSSADIERVLEALNAFLGRVIQMGIVQDQDNPIIEDFAPKVTTLLTAICPVVSSIARTCAQSIGDNDERREIFLEGICKISDSLTKCFPRNMHHDNRGVQKGNAAVGGIILCLNSSALRYALPDAAALWQKPRLAISTLASLMIYIKGTDDALRLSPPGRNFQKISFEPAATAIDFMRRAFAFTTEDERQQIPMCTVTLGAVDLFQAAQQPAIFNVNTLKAELARREGSSCGYIIPTESEAKQFGCFYNNSKQAITKNDGTTILSFFEGMDAGVSSASQVTTVAFEECFAGLHSETRAALKTFLLLENNSQIQVRTIGDQKICVPCGGPFAGQSLTLELRADAQPIVQLRGKTFGIFVPKSGKPECKLLEHGHVWGERGANSTSYNIYIGKGRDFDNPTFKVDVPFDSTKPASVKYFDPESAKYKDAHITKLQGVGLSIHALRNVFCICTEDQIHVPSIMLNGEQLTLQNRNGHWEVPAYPGYCVGRPEDAERLRLRDPYPLAKSAFLTLVPLATKDPHPTVRHFLIPAEEDNRDLYRADKFVDGTCIPEYAGENLTAFDEDSARVRPTKNKARQVELVTYTCRDGVVAPTDTASPKHEIYQNFVAINALLLDKQYDAAATVARNLQPGAFLSDGDSDNHMRRAAAEIVLDIRNMGPEAIAIKLFILDFWRQIEPKSSNITKYCTEELPDGKFMRFPANPPEKAGNSEELAYPTPVSCAIDSFMQALRQSTEEPLFARMLSSKLCISSEQAARAVQKSHEIFVAWRLKEGAAAATAEMHEFLTRNWGDKRRLESMVSAVKQLPWPNTVANRKAGIKDPKQLHWPARAKKILNGMSAAFSKVSTRFGPRPPQAPMAFDAQSDDPATQEAYDRMRGEFHAAARNSMASQVFVPQDLSLTASHLIFKNSLAELRVDIEQEKTALTRELNALIAQNHHEDIDAQAVIRCILLTNPEWIDDQHVRCGPTHFCPSFVFCRADYELAVDLSRTCALCAMLSRGYNDIDKLLTSIENSDSATEKAAAWEKYCQLMERIRRLNTGALMGYVGEMLGPYVSPDVLLSFGYYQGIIPSEEQTLILRAIMSEEYNVIKLMMGAGKSSVIAALIAMWQASLSAQAPPVAQDPLPAQIPLPALDPKLAVILAHKSQVGNACSFWKSSQDKMGQEFMALDLSRAQLQSPEILRTLLVKLENMRHRAGVLCVETGFFSKIELEIAEVLDSRKQIEGLHKTANKIAADIRGAFAQIQIVARDRQNYSADDANTLLRGMHGILSAKIKELEHIKKRIADLKDRDGQRERFEALTKLKEFFRNHGYVILDEVHLSANPKEEVNYPSGARESVPATLNMHYASFFKLVAEFNMQHRDEYGAGGLFGFANNSQAQKTDADFEHELEVFARHLYTCKTPRGGVVAEFLKTYGITFNHFIEILTGKRDANEYIPSVQAQGREDDLKDLDCIMTWLTVASQLRTCHRSEINRKAGLYKRPGDSVVQMVPFLASMTPSANNFASIFEQLTYYYMQASILDPSYFAPCLDDLVLVYGEKMATSITRELIDPSSEQQCLKSYKRVIGVEYMDATRIMRHKDSEPDKYEAFIRSVSAHLQGDPIAKLVLFESYSETSNHFNRSMQTDGCTTVAHWFAGNSMGCTGTLSDSSILPHTLRGEDGVKKQSGVEGAVFTKAHNDVQSGVSRVEFVGTETEPNISELFESVPEDRRSLVRLIVDRGGLFKTKPLNELLAQYADALNSNGARVYWIIHGSPENGFSAYDVVGHGKNTKHLTGTTSDDLRKAGLDPDECAAYFSERLATGTDAQFMPTAYAIITVNPNTNTPEEFAQAIMRLRQFFTGQHACFAVGRSPRADVLLDLPQEERFSGLLKIMSQNEGMNNKNLKFQAYCNQLHFTFKSIITDEIANASFEEAEQLREHFSYLFEREIDLDVVSAHAHRQTMVSASEILMKQLEWHIKMFSSVISAADQSLMVFSHIKDKFAEITRQPVRSDPADQGGELHKFIQDIKARFSNLLFPSTLSSGSVSSGAELEQEVETLVEVQVELSIERKQENQMDQETDQCRMRHMQTIVGDPVPRPKDIMDLTGGVRSQDVQLISPDMFAWASNMKDLPNPATLFRKLFLSNNYLAITAKTRAVFPFNELAPPVYLAVDKDGNCYILSDYEASMYMKNSGSWVRGMPVLFSMDGTVLVGDKDSLQERGDEIFVAFLFTGHPERVPKSWFAKLNDKPGELSPRELTAYVYLCEIINADRTRNGLPQMNEEERKKIAEFFPTRGSTGSHAGASSVFSTDPLSRATPIMDPRSLESVVLILAQSNGIDAFTPALVQQMTETVLNGMPPDFYVQLCTHFRASIPLHLVNRERLLVYDMSCRAPISGECPPGFGDQMFAAARAYAALERQDFDAASPLAWIQGTTTAYTERVTDSLITSICDIAETSIRMFTFCATDTLNLNASDQDAYREVLYKAFTERLPANFCAGDIQDAPGLLACLARSFMEAYEMLELHQRCALAEMEQVIQRVSITVEHLYDQRYSGILAAIAERDRSIAQLKSSLSEARRIRAIFAWIFVGVCCGLPLLFPDMGFRELLNFPIKRSAELQYLKNMLVDVSNPNRQTVIDIIQGFLSKQERDAAQTPPKSTGESAASDEEATKVEFKPIEPEDPEEAARAAEATSSIIIKADYTDKNLDALYDDFEGICKETQGNLSRYIDGMKKVHARLELTAGASA